MSQQNVARIMIMATISLNDAKIRAARFAQTAIQYCDQFDKYWKCKLNSNMINN